MTPMDQHKVEDMDLRSRVVTLEHRSTEDRQRIVTLETWRQQTEIAGARSDEQFKEMARRMSRIDANISRIAWAIILGVIGAGVTFIVKGGLNLP